MKLKNSELRETCAKLEDIHDLADVLAGHFSQHVAQGLADLLNRCVDDSARA